MVRVMVWIPTALILAVDGLRKWAPYLPAVWSL